MVQLAVLEDLVIQASDSLSGMIRTMEMESILQYASLTPCSTRLIVMRLAIFSRKMARIAPRRSYWRFIPGHVAGSETYGSLRIDQFMSHSAWGFAPAPCRLTPMKQVAKTSSPTFTLRRSGTPVHGFLNCTSTPEPCHRGDMRLASTLRSGGATTKLSWITMPH
jgi:hypothetical protein